MNDEGQQLLRAPARLWDPPAGHMEMTREDFGRILQQPSLDARDRMVMAGQLRMFEAADRLLGDETPRGVRQRASLIIRCQDCRGRAVAWVIWIEGRPLFLGEDEEDNYVIVTLLDDPNFALPQFYCKRRSFRLGREVPLDRLPRPGRPRVEVRVSHAV